MLHRTLGSDATASYWTRHKFACFQTGVPKMVSKSVHNTFVSCRHLIMTPSGWKLSFVHISTDDTESSHTHWDEKKLHNWTELVWRLILLARAPQWHYLKSSLLHKCWDIVIDTSMPICRAQWITDFLGGVSKPALTLVFPQHMFSAAALSQKEPNEQIHFI
jgi:hypothetical protein